MVFLRDMMTPSSLATPLRLVVSVFHGEKLNMCAKRWKPQVRHENGKRSSCISLNIWQRCLIWLRREACGLYRMPKREGSAPQKLRSIGLDAAVEQREEWSNAHWHSLTKWEQRRQGVSCRDRACVHSTFTAFVKDDRHGHGTSHRHSATTYIHTYIQCEIATHSATTHST